MIDTLSKLGELMSEGQPFHFYAKRLAPNDNSKNQIYLGGDFSVLNIIPHGTVYTDESSLAGSVRDRAKASVKLSWVNETGSCLAPAAQLILYPKYPEVRMSGFLRGCSSAPSEVMRSRDIGRVLFLGVLPSGEVKAFAVFGDHPLANELETYTQSENAGVLQNLSSVSTGGGDTKTMLLDALQKIHKRDWIHSQKMGPDGQSEPYAARNGGGYTLEALLGISPNSYAEPDYLGWEVKQYGVGNFEKNRAKSPITLMTSEPNSGEYKDEGVEKFLIRYGYPDRNGVDDRINFGGVYKVGGGFHDLTGLAMKLVGFDANAGKITDMNGGIYLVSERDNVAAVWNFSGMMEHWNRKHSRAVYVPSLFQASPPEYRYGEEVTLCEQTDFLLFLSAMASGSLYYDPALKMENASSPHRSIKRRSQFRIKQVEIRNLYSRTEIRHVNDGIH
jgi:hypothetical protein